MEQVTDTRGLKIALTVSVILFVLQLTTYFSTNMVAQLAAAFDSLSDIIISGFLWLSVYLSRKPADELHMFGHGRAQNVAALISASMLIFWLSFGAFQSAIPKFFESAQSEFQNVELALAVSVIAIFAYAIPFVDILRRKSRSPALKAQIVALLEMEVAFTAVLIGVILTAQGYSLADPIVSVFVASIIAISGVYLLKDNVSYLIGKAPSKEFMKKVESTAMSVTGVLGVHDLKAEIVGPGIVHAGFHIEIARGTPVEEADRIAEETQAKIGKETGCRYCVIHVDPKPLS
ncbi:MAG TPA: cation diffusion facilitator family transporter [Candidatus Sulfotelmatobacter sp.]|nr:cation diffusion facilitator family transporter [Candidatus Sulfotelmatobacter sp.]